MNNRLYRVYMFVSRKECITDYKKMVEKFNFRETNRIICRDRRLYKAWLYNWLFSFGKTKMHNLMDEQGLAYYSFYTPYCYKFGFMDKNDFVISPCWTRANLRGNRIYPTSINYLASVIRRNNENANIYILIRPENLASIKGVEKSNMWKSIGEIKKDIFKNYRKMTRYSEV